MQKDDQPLPRRPRTQSRVLERPALHCSGKKRRPVVFGGLDSGDVALREGEQPLRTREGRISCARSLEWPVLLPRPLRVQASFWCSRSAARSVRAHARKASGRAPVAALPKAQEAAASDECAARKAALEREPALPGAPTFEAARVEILGRARSVPGSCSNAPPLPTAGTGPEVDAIRKELLASADPADTIFQVLKRTRHRFAELTLPSSCRKVTSTPRRRTWPFACRKSCDWTICSTSQAWWWTVEGGGSSRAPARRQIRLGRWVKG